MTLLTFTDLDLDNDEAMKRAQRLGSSVFGGFGLCKPCASVVSGIIFPIPRTAAPRSSPCQLGGTLGWFEHSQSYKVVARCGYVAPSHLQEKVRRLALCAKCLRGRS